MKLRKPNRSAGATVLKDDPHWYKDAVIYELRVRSFMDSNGDGIGDFAGLASRLDYLQDLGVSALWLLPFYPSPGRDDGYDISDYTDVHPDLGTIDDFKRFLDEAHRRGIRVITELVINHTSDQHPWFQRARRAPAGSPERAFYVWSDTPNRYKDARIIFKDFEPSNWSWDPVAHQYYWHRFFNHQPDLNFENQAVQDAVFQVMDFWLELGVDGMRLDAVPYLFEAEGTNCENLPQTHEFLRKLRAHIDARYPNRMLLAEANQWPEDAAQYFGEGDECHMNFHFPIMPRIFMSIHQEDRFPIIDILAQTPQLHSSCQWALFLRNHDELTLEMVTDDERDYMYRAYAQEQAMRINLGIRRRLAPLLGNDRRKIELMNGLLFSLPGSPVLYYGDEIGMGDNVFLGDRNGVRTPMQWSADRNSGFSRCNPQRLILPVNIDPEYHYESLNVEAQQANPNSLLWWTKKMVALRQQFQAFGRGTIEFLKPDNHRVLAFLRSHGDEQILVVANLSRFPQYVELDLARHKGTVPRELFGNTRFPPVGEWPYLLTLGPHAFYWFVLEPARRTEELERAASYTPPSAELARPELLFSPEERTMLEELLPGYVEHRRWYEGRGRHLRALTVLEALPVATEPMRAHLLVVQVDYAEGEPERYALPVALATGPRAAEVRARSPQAVIANLRLPGEAEAALIDAQEDPAGSGVLLQAMARGLRLRGEAGELSTWTAKPIPPPLPEAPVVDPRLANTSHRHVAAYFDDVLVLKLYRRLSEGQNPEAEVLRFLNSHGPAPVAGLAGTLGYRTGRGEAVTVATLQGYQPTEGDAWAYTLEELGRYYERALVRDRERPAPALPPGGLLALAEQDPPREVREVLGAYHDLAELLGRRVAELHRALASDPEDPAFAPETYSALDQRSLYQSLRNLAGKTLRALRTAPLPEPVRAQADQLLAQEERLYHRLDPLLGPRLTALRTRCHGELHLGELLFTGKDFLVIDFDGQEDRPLSERRRKRTPLTDLGGLLSSLRWAARTALTRGAVREGDQSALAPWATLWEGWIGAALLRGYLKGADAAPFVPLERRELGLLLEVSRLDRLLTELSRELAKPGERVAIPLGGVLELLGPLA